MFQFMVSLFRTVVLRYAINTRQLEDLLAPLLESSEIIKTTGHGGALYRLNQPQTTGKGK